VQEINFANTLLRAVCAKKRLIFELEYR